MATTQRERYKRYHNRPGDKGRHIVVDEALREKAKGQAQMGRGHIHEKVEPLKAEKRNPAEDLRIGIEKRKKQIQL
ncbi:hypothetical protein ACFLRC_02475 [Candidatus Altiarchaeota archaeon]